MIEVFNFVRVPTSKVFRQLFEGESWTYTYLLADTETGEAVLVDPVRSLFFFRIVGGH